MHIAPTLGRLKLAELNAPLIRDFEDKLRAGTAPFGKDGAETKVRSQAMIKKIIGSLRALLADAVERGSVARNVVYDLRSKRRAGKERRAERRQKGKLKVGIACRNQGHRRGRRRPLATIPDDSGIDRPSSV